MKRNLFKKLSFVMALALVVTAIAPAAAPAKAAANPSLNATSKTLYVGKSYNFNVKNKVKKSKYAWTSSDKKVATVNAKNGVATAVAPGTATISCKVTLPTKKTKTLKATVTVKQDATAVTISNPVSEVKVGDATYQFKRSITPKASTNKTFYVIDQESNTAGAVAVNDKGIVNVANAGEFKIKAVTARGRVQFNAGTWRAESEWLTVKVPLEMTAKLTAVNKIELTFNGDVEDIITDDIEIREKETKVRQSIRSIEKSTDGKTLTVIFYNSLTDGKTYTVAAKEATSELAVTIGAIASIELPDKNIAPGTPASLSYTVRDVNGLDVTLNYPISKFVIGYSAGYLDSDNKLTLYTKGDFALVQLTYIQYTAEGNDASIVSAQAKYTAADSTINSITRWYIDERDDGGFDYINEQTVKLEDTHALLFVEYVKADGTKVRTQASYAGTGFTSSDVTSQNNLQFESMNTDILLIDKVTGLLYPIKVGKADIKVTSTEDDSFVTYLTIEVQAKRANTSIDANSTSFTLSNVDGDTTPLDAKTVRFILKDQYGKERYLDTSTAIKASVISGTESLVKVGGTVLTNSEQQIGTIANGAQVITFVPNSKTTGTTVVKVTIGSLSKVLTITVAEPKNGTTYAIEYKDKNNHVQDTLDLQNYNPYNGTSNLTFSVYEKDSTGVKRSVVSDGGAYGDKTWVATYSIKNSSGDLAKNTITDTVLADGAALPASISINAFTSQLPVGTYTIEVKITNSGAAAGSKPVTITKTFGVISEKPNVTYTISNVNLSLNTGTTMESIIANYVDASFPLWNGSDQKLTTIKSVKFVSSNATGLASSPSADGKANVIGGTSGLKFTVRVTEVIYTYPLRGNSGAGNYEFKITPNVDFTITVQ